MELRLLQAMDAFVALVLEPGTFPKAVQLSDSMAYWPPMRWAYRRMLRGLSSAQIEHLRQLTLQPLEPDVLLRLPEGSFGHEYARFVRHHQLDLDIYSAVHPPYAKTLERHWLLRRFAKVHDMHHFLLGFPVDFLSEMGLQVFNLRNFREPHAIISLAAIPLVLARYGETRQALAGVWRGWRLGGQVENLFRSPLEDMFAEPLDEVLRRLRIPERPAQPWKKEAGELRRGVTSAAR